MMKSQSHQMPSQSSQQQSSSSSQQSGSQQQSQGGGKLLHNQQGRRSSASFGDEDDDDDDDGSMDSDDQMGDEDEGARSPSAAPNPAYPTVSSSSAVAAGVRRMSPPGVPQNVANGLLSNSSSASTPVNSGRTPVAILGQMTADLASSATPPISAPWPGGAHLPLAETKPAAPVGSPTNFVSPYDSLQSLHQRNGPSHHLQQQQQQQQQSMLGCQQQLTPPQHHQQQQQFYQHPQQMPPQQHQFAALDLKPMGLAGGYEAAAAAAYIGVPHPMNMSAHHTSSAGGLVAHHQPGSGAGGHPQYPYGMAFGAHHSSAAAAAAAAANAVYGQTGAGAAANMCFNVY